MRKNTFITLLFFLSISAGLSLVTYRLIEQNSLESAQLEFRTLAASAAYRMEQRIRENTEALFALQTFYNTSETMDGTSFSQFTRSVLDRHPIIGFFSWAPRVKHKDRPAFEESLRKRNEEIPFIYELDENVQPHRRKDQDQYFPIKFPETNIDFFKTAGFDFFSIPERKKVAEQAIKAKQITATEVFVPKYIPDIKKAAFLIVPVFFKPPENVKHPEEDIKGLIISLIADNNVLSNDVFDPAGIYKDLTIDIINNDQPKSNNAALATKTDTVLKDSSPGGFIYKYSFPYVQKIWTVIVTPSETASAAPNRSVLEAAIVFIIGSLLSLFIVQQMNKRIAIEETVRERTNELKKTTLKLRRSMKDIADAKDSAEQANQLKSEFLANMSHEIRTPLNGVLGMCQLLEQTSLDSQQKEYTHTIMSSGRSLLAIISDILDLAKIESGQIQLERTDFNIMAIVKESMDTVSYQAMKKNLKTAVNISEYCQGTYLGDAGRIKQILVNLLNNAVKFTAAGEVSLELSKMENGDLCFRVRDSGSGIPEDQQNAIFERFRQVDGTSMRQHGGTGLGLPICKSLAELMGGRIGVNSEPGVGSEFWFSLPLEKSAITIEAPAWEEPAPLHDQRKTDQIKGQRVLVAEDNLINQQIIREALKTMRLDVTIVENGQLALEALEAAPYDLVLMDIQMPVMTGEEAIRWIRAADALYRDIPIIALTANAMSDAETRYLQAGANAYIVKPINLKTAITTISDILTEGVAKS
ncbi:ATP-binding protein [Emcibacter sp.]|uniref:ATP-binding protein n=1 Tax=Emcibacter sp. TaxID=1979954 RepID=UPI002AA7662F|nr:ATP-binding protein [Emcibacter sp.]